MDADQELREVKESQREIRRFVKQQIEQRLKRIEDEYQTPNWRLHSLIGEAEAYMECAIHAGIISSREWEDFHARALKIRHYFE